MGKSTCSARITSLVVSVAILVAPVASADALPPQTSASISPLCAPSKPGSTSSAVASAEVRGAKFTTTYSFSLATNGTAATSLKVWRNSELSLRADFQMDKRGTLQILVTAGRGFHGVRQVHLQSENRVTLQGTIDGRSIVPFRIGDNPESMRLADKTAVMPSKSVDADVQEALPVLMQGLQKQCSSTEPPAEAQIPRYRREAGQFEGNANFPGCLACLQSVNVALAGCLAGAASAATACLWAWPVCFAALAAGCAVAYYLAKQNICHDPDSGGAGGGGSCCPVSCGGLLCCEAGETCTSIGACCKPGLKACGENGCCSPTDTCIPGTGSCCPAGQNVCNGVCCPNANDVCNPQTQACCPSGSVCGNACCTALDPSGQQQVCTNSSSSTCCDLAHACGATCCSTSQFCSDSSAGTCQSCANCSGPGTECCFGQCCAAPLVCDATSHSCICIPNCANKCGGAPDGCGGTCTGACQSGQVCDGQTCCTPNCAGKCGGAPDGCGGTCTGYCPSGQVCDGQACCTPNCKDAKCGASNGCGEQCSGFCPPDLLETCQYDAKIHSWLCLPKPGGR